MRIWACFGPKVATSEFRPNGAESRAVSGSEPAQSQDFGPNAGSESQNSTNLGDLGPVSGPKSHLNSQLGPENPISGPKPQKQSNPGDSSPVPGPESPQNSTKTGQLAQTGEFGPFRVRNQPKLRQIYGKRARRRRARTTKSKFCPPEWSMVRMPLHPTLNREFASSHPTGVPKVHCAPTLGPGTPKAHCTLTLGAGIPQVQCTPTLAPGSLSTLAREEADFETRLRPPLSIFAQGFRL